MRSAKWTYIETGWELAVGNDLFLLLLTGLLPPFFVAVLSLAARYASLPMSPVALSALLALAAASSGVLAQDPSSTAFVPLASKHFSYPDGIVSHHKCADVNYLLTPRLPPALPGRPRQRRPWYPAGVQPLQFHH